MSMTLTETSPSADTSQRFARWLEALRSGDGGTMMSGLAEDIEFVTPSGDANKVIPYLGTVRGKSQMRDMLVQRDRLVETLSFEVHAYGTSGNRAWAEISTRERVRATGREYAIDAAHHFRFDAAGCIAGWRSYFDPGPELAAFRADLGNQLLAAAWHQDRDGLRAALDAGADPDTRDPATGLTPLLITAAGGNPELVEALLAAGADVFVVDKKGGASPLHKACQGGSRAVLERLVEAGAFVDQAAATTGHTPLMDAIWFKHADIVEYLLGRGAGLNLSTHYGFTLQQHLDFELQVTEHGRAELEQAALLIARRRADDQAKVKTQRLMAAVVAGDLQAARRALAQGAAVDEIAPILDSFNDGHTPLLVAARDGHTEIVKELLAAGANVNAIEPTFLAVPLHKAVYNGHADITRLLAAAPGVDLNVQGGTNGYTPLHDSLWHGFADCARVLVEAGARLDLVGHDGLTPLDLSIRVLGADHEVTRLIRERLAKNKDTQNQKGDSPMLFYVQMRWNIEGRLSFDQLWDLEWVEGLSARQTIESGMCKGIWKVAGQKRVIAIVEMPNAEELDRTIFGRLPMREYLEFEAIWPLRDYLPFLDDVKKHFKV